MNVQKYIFKIFKVMLKTIAKLLRNVVQESVDLTY